LERIPKVIETHERELAKTKEQIPVFEAAASGGWREEGGAPTLERVALAFEKLSPADQEFILSTYQDDMYMNF